MNWVDQALQPEHPRDCDLCERVAEMIDKFAGVIILPVRLPCGSVTMVGVHVFQTN